MHSIYLLVLIATSSLTLQQSDGVSATSTQKNIPHMEILGIYTTFESCYAAPVPKQTDNGDTVKTAYCLIAGPHQ